MVYKYEYANLLASRKMIEIKSTPVSQLPELYKTMTYDDWCKYYFKLSKKLLIKFWNNKRI